MYTRAFGRLVTHSVLPSGATPMPCDGDPLNGPLSTLSAGISFGSSRRPTSLCCATSTIAKPWIIRELDKHPLRRPVGVHLEGDGPDALVERQRPDWFLALLIDDGHQLAAIEPATMNLPSGVTHVLWTPPFVGMFFTRSSDAVSMTSDGSRRQTMPTYTRRLSLLIEMLFGRPLSAIFFTDFGVPAVHRVKRSARLSRRRTGATRWPNAAAPWSSGTPLTLPDDRFFVRIDQIDVVAPRISSG